MGKCKCDLCFIVGKCGIASEIEIAKEDKTVEFVGIGTIKGIRWFHFWSQICGRFMETEFMGHEHNCLS